MAERTHAPRADQPLPPELASLPIQGKVGDVLIVGPAIQPTATDRAALVRALALILVRAALVSDPEPGDRTEG